MNLGKCCHFGDSCAFKTGRITSSLTAELYGPSDRAGGYWLPWYCWTDHRGLGGGYFPCGPFASGCAWWKWILFPCWQGNLARVSNSTMPTRAICPFWTFSPRPMCMFVFSRCVRGVPLSLLRLFPTFCGDCLPSVVKL